MKYFELMDHYGRIFQSRFQSMAEKLPVDDYGWENHIYTGERFRRAHVEVFRDHKLNVLHVTVYPHLDDPSPVYGFDVIAGSGGSSGIFLDLSPTVGKAEPFCETPTGAARIVPEWGDFFSPYFVAVRPRNEEEFIRLLQAGLDVLDPYLAKLRSESGDETDIRSAQNRYSEGQRRNTKTRSALEKLLGEERADHFMRTVLFPDA